MAKNLAMPWPFQYELARKLNLDFTEILDMKVQFSVKVGRRYKLVRGRLRTEQYHCQCGSCYPETRIYLVPGTPAVEQSAT
jgi:hypothetical protein